MMELYDVFKLRFRVKFTSNDVASMTRLIKDFKYYTTLTTL